MTANQPWKVGIELELLAPANSSREVIAREIAKSCDGTVRRIFYPQSEFAPLDNVTIFENLTLGFSVYDQADNQIIKCVDDLTLIDDLDATKPPVPEWYRILSDDQRFLSLIEIHCDAEADQLDVLLPLAELYEVELECVNDDPLTRVTDKRGASIAMAATLPGERHRPCELITSPMTMDREEKLRHYLNIASELSFTVPSEAAIHIHFDGTALKQANVIANLINVFGHYRTQLRHTVGTNLNCRRLGDWPKALYRTASSIEFSTLNWQEAAERLREAEPEKFCDFNIVNLLHDRMDKNTFEVRIIPGSMDTDFILAAIRLFEALLKACVTDQKIEKRTLPDFMEYLALTGLDADDLEFWKLRNNKTRNKGSFSFLKSLRNNK